MNTCSQKMISKPLFNKVGQEYRKVTVTAGRNSRITRNFNREPGWSDKTYNRKLQDFESSLRLQLENGELLTQREKREAKRQEEAEKARLRTLRQYAEGVFMPTKMKEGIAENTRASYQMFLDKHILPVLGDFYLSGITSAMLKKLILDYQKKGYAHSSCVKLHIVLNLIFEMAALDDVILFSPMTKVKRPSARKDTNVGKGRKIPLTEQEICEIQQFIRNGPLKWRVFIDLLNDTGARRGEIYGLQWQDIDFEGAKILICRNVQYTPQKGVYVTTPKTGASRTVDIGSEIVELLRELRLEQARTRLAPYLFTKTGSSLPMSPQTATRHFHDIAKQMNIERFTPHMLRHASASRAITNGADIVSVSERLGHANVSTTLDMYAESNEEKIRKAGQIVRDALKASSL